MTSYALATSGALVTALSLNHFTRVSIADFCFKINVLIIFVSLLNRFRIEIESVGGTFGAIGCRSSGQLHQHSDDEKYVSTFFFIENSIRNNEI